MNSEKSVSVDYNRGIGGGMFPKKYGIHRFTPQQELFACSYLGTNSQTFGNCYQSAIKAGYTISTAKNLTHNNPRWLSDIIGNMKKSIGPESLTDKLSEIINNEATKPSDKIRAIEILMRHYGMFVDKSIVAKVSLEDLLMELK